MKLKLIFGFIFSSLNKLNTNKSSVDLSVFSVCIILLFMNNDSFISSFLTLKCFNVFSFFYSSIQNLQYSVEERSEIGYLFLVPNIKRTPFTGSQLCMIFTIGAYYTLFLDKRSFLLICRLPEFLKQQMLNFSKYFFWIQ